MGAKKETEKKYTTPSCRYNTGVECYKHIACDKCGWSPEVAAARIRKLQLDAYHVDHPVMSISVERGEAGGTDCHGPAALAMTEGDENGFTDPGRPEESGADEWA